MKYGKFFATVMSCLAATMLCSTQGAYAAASIQSNGSDQQDTKVGTGIADITPTQSVFLGGYGFGGWRPSTGIQHRLYVHVMAISSHKQTLLIGSIDSQGYFSAYQQGPYGIDAIKQEISSQTGIPTQNILFSSTHSHAAPDTVGVWGGTPTWYLQQVHDACVTAAVQAVEDAVPAEFFSGQVQTDGLSTSFTSDNSQWPRDQTLRVLIAKKRSGKVIATLVNFGVHPTVLPRTNSLISPDWPSAMTDDLTKATGGAFSMFLVGDVGRTWPAFPASVMPPSDPYQQMDLYGHLVADQAINAIQSATPLSNSDFGAVQLPISEPATSGALMPLYSAGLIMRSKGPAYLDGTTIKSSVTAFRIGPDILYGIPAEPYPDLTFELEKQIHAPTSFVAGLANDQLGYAAPANAYPGIVANSPTDEAQFVINPSFGDDVVTKLEQAATSLGFASSN